MKTQNDRANGKGVGEVFEQRARAATHGSDEERRAVVTHAAQDFQDCCEHADVKHGSCQLDVAEMARA